MEHNGAEPRSDLGSVALSELSEIYSRRGPFLTVYIDSRRAASPSDHEMELRWRSLRRSAEDDGAPEEVLDMVEGALGDPTVIDETVAVVANAEGLALVGDLGVASGRDMALWQELPRLAPVLAWQASLVPYVGVLSDRVGADIAVVDREVLAAVATVEGSSLQIARSAPGGWSQRRYQQRAENQWEANSADVAEEVARWADEVSAEFIAVAGDVRAVQFLEEHLPDRLRDRVHEIRGGRHEGDDLDGSADDIVRLQADVAARRLVDVLEVFAERRATSGAVDGTDATFEALQRGMVDQLLVVDDLQPGARSEHCWISDHPTMLSNSGAVLRDLGLTPRRAPVVDAAIRAALAQGGSVSVVPASGPSSPRGGVGALLRN